MKTYKKLHESKEVANIHIAKIKAKGGEVKQSIQNGKILLEYSFASEGYNSNLTPQQQKLVRTPEFKAWFGDWENPTKNTSKVVDENGEPLVVYHTSNNEFYIFDKKKSKGGFYFSANKDRLSVYGKSKLNEYFLNIKNPTDDEFSVKGFDGVMDFGQMKIRNAKFLYEIICFSSNQIKLADGTNTKFSSKSDDVRF